MNAVAHETQSRTSLDEARGVLRCTCGSTDLAADSGGLKCNRCSTLYPIKAHVIDALPNPSRDVIDEITGMMREHDLHGDYRAYMIREERVIPFDELKAYSGKGTFDYYGSTEINFRQALQHVPLTGRERVLEVGAEGAYPFLDVFREKGCSCFAANVHVWYDEAQTRADWPVRVVADMHALPFADESFDVVLYSACTHHGAPLDVVFREAARVTKPGGYVININEPIRGVVKHLRELRAGLRAKKGEQVTGRNELVHEHEYSIFEYLRAFRAAGLTLEASLFCDYYDQRLREGRVSGVRFSGLASVMSRLWKREVVRKVARQPGLWLGQMTIGLQMNVVLRKPQKNG